MWTRICFSGLMLIIGYNTIYASTDQEEQAVRKAIDMFQGRFNVRDNLSLVGDVDFEYIYVSAEFKRPGVYSVMKLADLKDTGTTARKDTGTTARKDTLKLTPETVRTIEEALVLLPPEMKDTLITPTTTRKELQVILEKIGFRLHPGLFEEEETPPDLLGVDVTALKGRNKRNKEDSVELALRRLSPSYVYRKDITTATQDYNMAERRLLRWDLGFLFDSFPPEVILILNPVDISINDKQAIAQVDYYFGIDVRTLRSKPFEGKSGQFILNLRKLEDEWRVEDVRSFVDEVTRVVQR